MWTHSPLYVPSGVCCAVMRNAPPGFINEVYDNTRIPAQAAVRVFRLESSAQNCEQDRLLTATKYTRTCSARQRTGVCWTGARYPTGTTVLSNERLQNLSLGDQTVVHNTPDGCHHI